MQALELKDIPNLDKFCKRIILYNNLFIQESTRCLFFVSLLSTDKLLTVEDCDYSIEQAKFILDNIDLFKLEYDERKAVIKYSKEVLKIAKRDRKEFLKQDKSLEK